MNLLNKINHLLLHITILVPVVTYVVLFLPA